MIKKHRKAIMIAIIIIVVLCIAAWLLFFRDFLKTQEDDTTVMLPEETISYNADEDVAAAIKKYEEGCNGAKIIRDDTEPEEVTFAIAFQGLSDQTVNSQVLDLLEKYGQKGTFFVSGMMAAEDEDAVQTIIEEGHELGNNALNAESGMEKMTPEEVIESLVRSHKVLHTLTDTEPDLLYCNSTLYTDTVCQAATAAG